MVCMCTCPVVCSAVLSKLSETNKIKIFRKHGENMLQLWYSLKHKTSGDFSFYCETP